MQSIAATAGLRIDQRHGQIVAAEKPCEGACCVGFPFGIAIRPPCREAGRRSSPWLPRAADRRRGDVAAARQNLRCRPGGNGPPAPFAASSASAGTSVRHRHSRAFASPCPSRSGPAAGARCRRQALPRTTPSPASRPTREWTSACRQETCRTSRGAQIIRSHGAIGVQTQQRECPRAWRAKRSPRSAALRRTRRPPTGVATDWRRCARTRPSAHSVRP